MNARSHVAKDLQRHICRDVWDVWLKAKTTKECQVSIEDLIPGSRCTRTLSFVLFQHSCSLLTRYKFRIKAENAYGISDESQESDPFDVNQPIAGESHEPPGVFLHQHVHALTITNFQDLASHRHQLQLD